MRQSYAKLAHGVELGYQLMMIKAALCPEGFLGHAKGQGFSAWCEENGISRRRAYRLIELSDLMFGIVFRARDSRILGAYLKECLAEGKPIPPFDVLRRAIRDRDNDTNG